MGSCLLTDPRQIPFEKLAYASEMLRVLGHPVRLRLVELIDLAGEEMSVGALVHATGEPQPTVSQHLNAMRLRGMVKSRRQGGQVFYSLAHDQVRRVLECVRGCDIDFSGKEDD